MAVLPEPEHPAMRVRARRGTSPGQSQSKGYGVMDESGWEAGLDGAGGGEDAAWGREGAEGEGVDDGLFVASASAGELGEVGRAVDGEVGDVGLLVGGAVEAFAEGAGAAGLAA